MDVRQLESTLTTLFTRDDRVGRQLVFWYDPRGEFGEDVAELSLPGGVEKLTLGATPFTTKYKLLVEAPSTPFLLYAPFAEPPPGENWLLDLQQQGEVFSADQAALLFRFYGFYDRGLEDYLRAHLGFFKAKRRRDALAALGLPKNANEMDLRVGLMCVLAGLRVTDADALIRAVLVGGLREEENALWQELTKYVTPGEFWTVAQGRLGVPADTATLRDLFIRLALTHLQHDLNVPLTEGLRGKLIQPSTRAYVFVSSWLRDSADRERWAELSRQLEGDLGVREFAASLHPSAYTEAETFEAFDQALVHAATEALAAGTPPPGLGEWLSARRPLFWFEHYRAHYRALAAAAELLELLERYAGLYSGTVEALFKRYAETFYQIDGAYRRYVAASDALTDPLTDDVFNPLTDALERRYTYEFLEPLGEAWSDALKGLGGAWSLGVEKQWSFYRNRVGTVVERNDREKVFVIVSDALRFEVAAELQGRLTHALRGEAELSAVLSVLPSVTKLGMAALLPHGQLSVGDKGEVLADGRSTQGLEARGEVLNAGGVSSLAFKASELLAMGQEGRGVIKPHRVVYVYQDVIDAAGDHPASERGVFAACERAVDEILALVKRIVNQLNGTNVVVTSDHGFLYQRQALGQHDKVARADDGALGSGRRHIFGRDLSLSDATQTFNLPYLGSALQAQSPRGTLRYAVQGGGAGYVHGGASLQEVCVPVLSYKHVRAERGDDGASRKVGVRVSATTRRVTNTHFTVRLVQDEPVGGRVRARQVQVKLVAEDGGALTNAYPLNLDSAAPQATDREYIARLTVGAQAPQGGTCYLVILDAEDDLELLREPWQLSLAFTDDFGEL